MSHTVSAPLLSRVKSWQLVSLGLTGWCTLYSVALLTWGASSTLIGNTQGGCFAATMTLASLEARRLKKGSMTVTETLHWTANVTTERVNQVVAQNLRRQNISVEKPQAGDAELGFGVRAVNAGRSVVFETARWQEPVIDLPLAESTEENRKQALANLAVIVSQGVPDKEAKNFVRSKPLRFLCGEELKDIIASSETPPSENPPSKQA